jgi:two-component system, OmpR family, heavy metal sensor histidine kinase CusS
MKPVLPLRWRFALWFVALAAAGVLLFAVGSFWHLHREQIEAVDLEIEGEAKQLLALRRRGLLDQDADAVLGAQPWLAFAHIDQTGAVLRRSQRLAAEVVTSALATREARTMRAAEVDWRVVAVVEAGETFVVAYDLAEVNDVMRELGLVYLALLLLVLSAAAVGGWLVAGRVLVPVRQLTLAAEAIQANSLGHRMAVPVARDELRRLATVFNAMLDRLERGFAQARRFSADASHELRTPLAILQGQVERLLRASDWPRAHEDTLVSLQEEIARLDRITEHLLVLASFDSGRARLVTAEVDFSALTREACEDASLLAEARAITLAVDVPAGVCLRGDAHHLRRLLLNLPQNGVAHNARGGQVRCALAAEGACVRLSVANTSEPIPLEARARLFERFFRADPSRTRREGHGLGLALCHEIVRAHGGEIALSAAPPLGWVEFVVTLPLGQGGAGN